MIGWCARILVVDDEPLVAESVGHALELLGHEATMCSDSHSAIEALANGFSHDLVIADRRMPGLSGDGIARWAKSLRPGLPVIFMSGLASLPSDDPARDETLCKPFGMEELADAVNRALASARPLN